MWPLLSAEGEVWTFVDVELFTIAFRLDVCIARAVRVLRSEVSSCAFGLF